MAQEAPLRRYVFLGALFLCSFLLPVWVLSFLLKDSAPTITSEQDPVFPQSLPVRSRGAFFTVATHEHLTPREGRDFVLFGWFKFDVLPEPDKEAVIISKIDSSRPLRPGFSIEIARHGDSFRPSVYWKNSDGKGGRYEFNDFKLSVRQWYAMVLSYQQPTVLGFHLVTIDEQEKPTWALLGGYQLRVPVFPATNVPLQIGAPQLGTFRGSIGPVGVISGKKIRSDMKDILKTLARDPLNIKAAFHDEDIVFLTLDGQIDLSNHHLEINQSTKIAS